MARRAGLACLAVVVGFVLVATLIPSATESSTSIAFKARTTGNNGAGALTLSISAPSGMASGDVLLCQIVVSNASTMITAPGGWVQIQRTQSTSSALMASYYKVVGNAEPGSYTFSFDSSQPGTGAIADYVGVDGTGPIDASSSLYNANTSTASFAQVTTTHANDLLVALVGVTGNTSVTPPANLQERYDANDPGSTNGKTVELSDRLNPLAGATAVQAAQVASKAGSNLTQLVALSPASTSTGTTTPTATTAAATATLTLTSTPTQTATAVGFNSISFQSQVTATNATGASSLTLSRPAGALSGDVLLAQIAVNNAATAIAPPAGWVTVRRTQSTSSIAMASYYKIAGSAEPSSYTFSFDSAQPATGGMAHYSGVSVSDPVDVSSGQYNPNTATVTFAPLTTSYPNDLLVALVAVSANTEVTPPANFVERYDVNDTTSSSGKTIESSDMLDPTTGLASIGTAIEVPNASSNLAQLIALRPATQSTPTSTPTVVPTGSPTATSTTTPTVLMTATPTSTPLIRPTPSSDPVLAIGGDIACDPLDSAYNGGIGTGTECQMRSTSALLSSTNPSMLLALGDEQYEDGALSAFQQSYDPTWGKAKSITQPVPGNHEYNTAGATGYYTYFGTAAGDPSRGYYSFDLGAWHIVALNGECANVGGCGSGSPQEQWLRADLSAHTNPCTLAYWHEPRFSSGIGGNDSSYTDFWQDLYSAGAELIINGHEHLYERFAPQDPNGNSDPARGVVEIEAGTGGASLFTYSVIQPNSLVRNNNTFGILLLTLHAGSYEWNFVPISGQTFTDSGAAACH
jgi:Calcineurin-like phosphoesterase